MERTPFWEARWLNGVSPRELAPGLYAQARYRSKMVYRELQNSNWIRNIRQLNTETLLDEFVLLFSTLTEIQLNDKKTPSSGDGQQPVTTRLPRLMKCNS
jgi:hypothetical protein